MIQVEQTELADYSVNPVIRGNCLAACVASIFEVPLEMLQGVYETQSLWAWLGRHTPGAGVIARSYVDNAVPLGSRNPGGFSNLPGITPWIAVVKSLRTPHMHCVVMVRNRLVWDPHPLREMGVGEQTGDYAFTLDRPEKVFSR